MQKEPEQCLEKNRGGKAEEVHIKASALFCSSSFGQVLIVIMTHIVLEKQQELIITLPGALGIIMFRSFQRNYRTFSRRDGRLLSRVV
jgi:hypothetical protein